MFCNEYTLRITTAPAIEPVTTAEVKLHTRVSEDDQDTMIDGWIKSGRELAEIYQRRAYIEQTITLSFDKFPSVPFYLPRCPVSEVTQMKYYDTDNDETIIYDSSSPVGTEDNYLIDIDSEPARITLAYSQTWPTTILREINAFKVVYKAGYGATADTTPQNVKDAIMLYCDWRYENRAAETNVVPQQFYDLLSGERVFI